MWLNENAPIKKQDLVLSKPFVNSAGILGFVPDPHAMPFLPRMGAFITHPISRRPRKPAGNRCCLPYQGGFLLHTGLPNPGISRTVKGFSRAWAGATLPVILHLLAETPRTLAEMVRKVEGLENVRAVELGLPPDLHPQDLPDFLEAASGELPVVVCLTPDQIPALLDALISLQPSALHLVQPRGSLPGPGGEIVTGRLYGPANFPILLQAAQDLADAGFPVIADGGVTEPWQSQALLEVGVTAVGLGSALWQVNPEVVFPTLVED